MESFLITFTTNLILFGYLETSGYSLSIPLANPHKGNIEVCKSEECIAMSESLLRKMDRTIDPCQDFYRYSCGKYTKIDAKNEIDKSLLKANEYLLKVVKAKSKKDDHRALKIAREMFKFCIKHESNVEDLKKKISYLGGWSLLNPNWKENDFSLVKFYTKSMEIGYLSKTLFEISTEMNPANRQNIIAIKPRIKPGSHLTNTISQQLWPLDLDLSHEDVLDYFRNKFIPMLALKMNITSAKLGNELWQFNEISKRIGMAYVMPTKPILMKLSELKDKYDSIPWIEVLGAVFQPMKIKISNENLIHVSCPDCLASLNADIRNIPKKFLATLFMGSFLYDTIMDADDDMIAQFLQLQEGRSKEEYCTDKIFSLFSRIMDYEYYKQYYDKNLISAVKDFSEKLRNAMVSTISVSKLVDGEDRNKTIDKVKKMVFKIGYDDEISNGQKLSLSYFDKLNVNPNIKSYLPSLFNIMKFTIEKSLGEIGKPEKLPYLSATLRNCAYYAYHNTVSNMLAGVLYSKGTRPQYLNYGGLGIAIAHEMNHAFDLMGKQFDNNGAYTATWWNPKTSTTYQKKIECIVSQYSNFTNLATGNLVNGHQTMSENFCDIGGTEVAFKAYHDFPKNSELSLPNFKRITPQRMFWITLASTWCANPTKTSVLESERTGVHAIEPIRVNGALMNNKEFAKDWGCKDYSQMNPIKKCTVWK